MLSAATALLFRNRRFFSLRHNSQKASICQMSVCVCVCGTFLAIPRICRLLCKRERTTLKRLQKRIPPFTFPEVMQMRCCVYVGYIFFPSSSSLCSPACECGRMCRESTPWNCDVSVSTQKKNSFPWKKSPQELGNSSRPQQVSSRCPEKKRLGAFLQLSIQNNSSRQMPDLKKSGSTPSSSQGK